MDYYLASWKFHITLTNFPSKMVCAQCSFIHNAMFFALSIFGATSLMEESCCIITIHRVIYNDNVHHLEM